ncbi:MAG: peptidase inhibitor family I36 protein [Pseudonocardiaceae bacterium]
MTHIRRALAVAGVSTAIAAGALAAAPVVSASQDGASTAAQSAAAAPKCAKGHFCAFKGAKYKGKILDSTAGRGAQVDVVDKKTSSGINRTSNEWVGVNDRQFPLPDDDVFKFAPHSRHAHISSNNTIDYFSVR